MFANRHDQENLTHLHNQAAASKPLNQSNLKTPGPKNAAPKTPFRNPNDENSIQTVSKAGGKAPLFTTPAAQQTKPRAVLGAKTTNAKTPGAGLKTVLKPTAAPGSTQKISPRLRRNKVRIHQPTLETTGPDLEDGDDSAPEVEYCPPPSIRTPPLPDYPDDVHTIDWAAHFNRNQVLSDTIREALGVGIRDENGLTEGERKARDDLERRQDARMQQVQETWLEEMRFTDPEIEALRVERVEAERKEREALKRKADAKGPSKVNARSAAVLLGRTDGRQTEQKKLPSFAAPTKAAKSRVDAVGQGKESEKFGNAKAASRTTMGYSKGRQVSATKRAPLSAAHRAPVLKGGKEAGRPKAAEVVKPISAEVDQELDAGEPVEIVDEAFDRLVLDDFVLEM